LSAASDVIAKSDNTYFFNNSRAITMR
jgi:hypothetical protein